MVKKERQVNPRLKYIVKLDHVIVIMRTGDEILLDRMDDVLLANHGYGWMIQRGGVVVSFLKGERRSLHRVIMNAPKGTMIDHINMNFRDNRRTNLRFCTYEQNMANKKPRADRKDAPEFKGVRRNKRLSEKARQWNAALMCNGKYYYGPTRHTAEEAAKDYDELAKQYHGTFARLNFPD